MYITYGDQLNQFASFNSIAQPSILINIYSKKKSILMNNPNFTIIDR